MSSELRNGSRMPPQVLKLCELNCLQSGMPLAWVQHTLDKGVVISRILVLKSRSDGAKGQGGAGQEHTE